MLHENKQVKRTYPSMNTKYNLKQKIHFKRGKAMFIIKKMISLMNKKNENQLQGPRPNKVSKRVTKRGQGDPRVMPPNRFPSLQTHQKTHLFLSFTAHGNLTSKNNNYFPLFRLSFFTYNERKKNSFQQKMAPAFYLEQKN